MSRVGEGRYVLVSREDRDAIVEALSDSVFDGEHEQAKLVSRVRYAAFHDVNGFDHVAADVAAILHVWREQQLSDSELADLMATALLVSNGFLGANEATSRIRDVVEARQARRRREESLGDSCGTCGKPANEVADHVVDGVVYHARCIPEPS